MRLLAKLFCFTFFAGVLPAAPPLIHHDFEENASGWMAYGSGSAKVQITHEPASVKTGKGALQLDYEASNTQPGLAVLPLKQPLTGMQSVRFWILAESPMAVTVTLSEKQGGRYAANFWLDAHAWQRVELTPEDFILAAMETDPKDPDGKLDLDQVQAIGIVDVSQILNAVMAERAALAVVAHTGPQKLLLDEFEVSGERPAWFHPRPPLLIENFQHPQLNWLTLGGADLKRDSSRKVIAGDALESSYQQIDEHFALLLHLLPPMDLTGATHLAFDIASDKDVNLIVSLTEQVPGKADGPHYNADIEVRRGGKAARRQIALSAFELDENGPVDANGKLDLDKLKSFGILDVTSAYTGETGVNTIRIGNIEAVKAAAQ